MDPVHTEWKRARAKRDAAARRMAFLIAHGKVAEAQRAATEWSDRDRDMMLLEAVKKA